MFKTLFNPWNLQLFAEGEGSGATGAAAASQTGESPQGAEQTSAAPAFTEEQFNEYMKNDKAFRGFVNKHTEGIVKNRLKGTKEEVARYKALYPVVELLAQRYHIDTENPEYAGAMIKALEDDDAFFMEEAEKRGVSVDSMRQISKMERENAAMKKAIAEQENQRKADELLKGWMAQAEKVKEIYPSFDLQTECENPDFVELIKLPIFNLQSAFEFIHKDELQAAANQVVAQQVEQRIANKVASNANLPVENGYAVASAAVAKKDVRNMTRAEREEINRRVARGEKFSFGG